MLAGTDDHLTWPSPVILNLESTGSTHLESEIRVLTYMWYHLLQVSQATHPCFALVRLLLFRLNFCICCHFC